MATAQAGRSELDAYREEADRFITALTEEYYLHFAGLKDELELAPIYERYSDLATLDASRRLGAAAQDGSAGATELWRFACERYLEELVREEREEIARLQVTSSIEVDGQTIGYRLLVPALANEPDRARRELLERARSEFDEERLNPHYLGLAEKRREGTRRLGAETCRRLYERFGFPLDRLAAQCRGFLADTEDLYVRTLDPLFRARIGVGLEQAGPWDLRRLFRAAEWDAGFPAGGMVPALEGALADLGIDLRSQANVHIDVEPRPKKLPRAFCAPIEVPQRVMLVIQPIGGARDWQAFFHEAGHAEHHAHTSAELPLEARRLGSNAVTEGWAILFEHLVGDPAWLARRLDFGRPEDFAAESAAALLLAARLYAGKFLYELELHGGAPLDILRQRYIECMLEATKIELSPADFLSDVLSDFDIGFYSSNYLRAWAFEARLREFLREEFGTAWFARREAGSLLRELWSEGQRMSVEELLREVTGAEVELEAIAERVRGAVRP